MRIISQDGKWDLPYDRIVIDKSGEKIYAQSNLISCNDDDNYVEIAEYSTPEKAEKAMEMLHNTFLKYAKLNGGQDGNISVAPNIWVLPKVFQFPADEEIEVKE